MDENLNIETNVKKETHENNISIPKPVFALLIIALLGSLCYSTYNAGYMKGLEKSRVFREAPAANSPSAQNGAEATPFEGNGDAPRGSDKGFGPDSNEGSTPDNGMGDIFRDMNPFDSNKGGNEEKPGGGENADQGAYLDIVAATVSDEAKASYNIPSGVLIMKVSEGGAAEKAGIKEHSVITALDGEEVSSIDSLKEKLSHRNPGETASVTLYEPSDNHGFTEKTVHVTLSDGEAVSKEN